MVIAVFAFSELQGQIDLSVPKDGRHGRPDGGETLVPFPVGILLLGAACAVVISTGMNYLLSPSTTVIRDIYQPFLNKKADPKKMVALQKVLVVVIGVLAFLLATQLKSVLEMSFFAYTIYGVAITHTLRRAHMEEGHESRRPGLDHFGNGGLPRLLRPVQDPRHPGPRRRPLGHSAHLPGSIRLAGRARSSSACSRPRASRAPENLWRSSSRRRARSKTTAPAPSSPE